MSEYQEILNNFDDYINYKKELKNKIEKKRDEFLKKDFLMKLGNCFDEIESLKVIKLIYSGIRYDKEKLGEPLLHTKKMNIQRWIFFILMTLLLPVLYVNIFLVSFKFIDKILDFSSLYEIIMASISMISVLYFYLLTLAFLIPIESITISDKDSKDFIKLIKENFSILIFPFNKVSTDRLSIQFIIGTKGLFIYSEFNASAWLRNKYTYRELSEKGYINNNAFKKLLSASCRKEIFDLATKYYGS